jgi:hypothetical protein
MLQHKLDRKKSHVVMFNRRILDRACNSQTITAILVFNVMLDFTAKVAKFFAKCARFFAKFETQITQM